MNDHGRSCAPVALFVYNRPGHTKTTLEALVRNALAEKTHLHIFSDGPKHETERARVEGVRKIVRAVSGFASVRIVEREQNLGLANSVITGVTEVIKDHTNIVVVEDDLITTPQFLTYMNAALTHYRDDPHVFSVTGHNFPATSLPIPLSYKWDTFAAYRCSSWSWGTWSDRWARVDWSMSYYGKFIHDKKAQEAFSRGGPDMIQLLELQHEGEIDSWAIRFCYAHFAHNMYCIYPVKSLVKNTGLDDSGTHCVPNPLFHHAFLDENWSPLSFCPGSGVDTELASRFYKVFCPLQLTLVDKIITKGRNLTGQLVGKVRRVVAGSQSPRNNGEI